MRTSFSRSIVSLLSALIMFVLLWLIVITMANSQPIVYAAPDGGVVTNCTDVGLTARVSGRRHHHL